MNFVRVNAEERFLSKLAGVEDPQEKRHIIGAEFGYVFRDEAERFGITKQDFLAQGTIYPDVIESGKGDADVIKSHHNKLLPAEVVARFKDVLEPLDLLFKDEVRQLGRELGLPEYLVMRQPFPGPVSPTASSALSQRRRPTPCGRLTSFTVTRSPRPAGISRSASISPC